MAFFMDCSVPVPVRAKDARATVFSVEGACLGLGVYAGCGGSGLLKEDSSFSLSPGAVSGPGATRMLRSANRVLLSALQTVPEVTEGRHDSAEASWFPWQPETLPGLVASQGDSNQAPAPR